MTDIAAMVKALIESGTPADVAAEIVAKAFVAGTKSASSRKSVVGAAYTEDFNAFWKSYPTTPVMSKKQAYGEWAKLSVENRLAAADAVIGYREWLAPRPDHPVVHACRFLSQRRFEGFASRKMLEQDQGIYVKRDTPQWDVVSARYQKEHGKTPPTDRNGGWWFPREWFPAPQLVESVA